MMNSRAGRPRHSAVLLLLGCLAQAGCSSDTLDADDEQPSDQPGQGQHYSGTLVVHVLDFQDHSKTEYFLRSGEAELHLHFATDPDLAPGVSLEVWGSRDEDGLRVDDYRLVRDELAQLGQELIGAPAFPPRSFAFVLVDIGGGVNISADDARQRMFGTAAGDDSVKQYYLEASYGMQDIVGDVFGPLSYNMQGCDTRGMTETLRGQIPGDHDHYLWYMGSRTNACSWSGLAESGAPDRPQENTWYNGSSSCVVLVQEPGHNFGMMHSSSMACGSTPFADDPDNSCEHDEYGDRYDPMGRGCFHMNAWQKVYQGWLSGCNSVRVNSSGTFTLLPLETACDGIQVLQIPMPKVRPFSRAGGGGQDTVEDLAFYYLELRTNRGFDASLQGTPTVLVRVAEDYRTRSQRGRHTWILDMDTQERNLQGLGQGESYTDPAGGVTFSIQAISQESATVQVDIEGGEGAPTCLDGTVITAPGPINCGGDTGTGGMGGTGGSGGGGGSGGMGGMGGSGGTGGGSGGSGGGNPGSPRVVSFTLIDAELDEPLFEITSGEALDLATLPLELSLRADTDPPTVGSVTFNLDGALPTADNTAPYSLTGDVAGDYQPWTLGLGSHTVTATPYSEAEANGAQGESATVQFALFDSSSGSGGSAATGGSSTGGSSQTGGGAAVGSGGAPSSGGGGVTTAPEPTGGASAGLGPSTGSSGDGPPKNGVVTGSCGCRTPGEHSGNAPAAGFLAALLGLALAHRRRRLTG